MSEDEMPEWFKEICERIYYKERSFLKFKELFWEELSKPENLKRIPEVENLIGHAKAACQFPHKDHSNLELAIKPFEEQKESE